MLKLSTKQILKNLEDEKEFFLHFQKDFTDNFSEKITTFKPGLVNPSVLQTFGIKLFTLLFGFEKDPTDELYYFSKKLAQNDINLKPIIIKSLLNSIGKFALYLADKDEQIEKLKNLITLVDIYLTTIDRAYMDYFEEIKSSLDIKENERNEIIFSLLKKVKERNEDIDIIDFYKELPIILKSKILKIYEDKIVISIYSGKFNYLKKEENVYLKHPNFPKSLKADIFDLNPQNETITLYNFIFSEIEQDKRKFVRVQPENKMEANLSYENKIFKGYIKDISVGGIGVYLENVGDLKNGCEVDIFFLLSSKPVKTKGTIKYIHKTDNFNIIGIDYFSNLDIKTEELISSYITHRQFDILKELKGK